MNKIETIQDFTQFLNCNRKELLECTVRIEDLPVDNEWSQEDDWEKVYQQEGAKR